ncbi:NAD-dependent epimerase/dehydratase family protein [Cellulomonas sp.]|uniref:NAD-dependent epimerase/dehydratase family protein n=1 Tax=Cellulomonas sp. TaxID=40001 RepID=UPI001B210779|nr:NAD-dependent epimerase/dehydratase family protein [Cellulomonas sp.]MBO9555744.1 NAD-dependent epimerase/dehydratase family protein [Cellulomonas sp.]
MPTQTTELVETGAPVHPIIASTAVGRVVVLGGTGFIGSAVVRHLEGEADVVVVGRGGRAPGPVNHGTRFLAADLSDAAAVESVLAGADSVVYSVAAMLPAESTASPVQDVTHSLTPLLHVLEHLRHHPTTRLVFLSSGGTVYGNPDSIPVHESHATRPTSSYGVLKLAAEKYIQMYATVYGIDARVLRVANAYGPRQPLGRSQGVVGTFIDAALHDRPLQIFGTGRAVRDYIHVDDVALAVQAALRTDGPEVVNVATGIGTSLVDIVAQVEQLSGSTLRIEMLPERPFDVHAIVLDASAFRAMVGVEPVPFQEGLTATFEVAKADHDAKRTR